MKTVIGTLKYIQGETNESLIIRIKDDLIEKDQEFVSLTSTRHPVPKKLQAKLYGDLLLPINESNFDSNIIEVEFIVKVKE